MQFKVTATGQRQLETTDAGQGQLGLRFIVAIADPGLLHALR